MTWKYPRDGEKSWRFFDDAGKQINTLTWDFSLRGGLGAYVDGTRTVIDRDFSKAFEGAKRVSEGLPVETEEFKLEFGDPNGTKGRKR